MIAFTAGGIPEVVVPERIGLLVDLELKPGTFDPFDAPKFSSDLAAAINREALDLVCVNDLSITGEAA